MSSPAAWSRAPLEAARLVVAHDLHGRWERLLDEAVTARRLWVEQWPDGAVHVTGLLAQDVQEAVHASADPAWPLCPSCRDHPLLVEPDLGPDPFWVCARSGLPVAEVGRLPS